MAGASDGAVFGHPCASKCIAVAAMDWVRLMYLPHNTSFRWFTVLGSRLRDVDCISVFLNTKMKAEEFIPIPHIVSGMKRMWL